MKQHLHKILFILLAVLLGIGGYSSIRRSDPAYAASGGRIYITPASGSYTVGNEFSAIVRVSSPSKINAAFVRLYYNGRGLKVIDIQRGADFPNQNTQTQHTPGDEGKIYMESTKNSTTAGDFHFATIRFKITAAGTWGFRPGTESEIINFPNNSVTFTVGRADYTGNNPAPTQPTQPTQPSQPPAPAQPTRPTTPAQGGTSRAPTATAPAASAPSASGLQISNLAVTELNYKSALLTWTTTKPSISKINFSTDKEDLYEEQLSESPVTSHSLRLEGENVKAGNHYFFRVSAEDESGPVTVDGEFDTKAIPVVIKVTDESDTAVADATVTVKDGIYTTDENGEISAELPEGDVTVFAQKDNLSREITATIEVPTSETVQRISLSMSETTSVNNVREVQKKKSSPLLIVLLPIIGITIAVIGFLLWRRRRMQTSQYYSDPLDAANYTSEPIPSTPAESLPVEPSPMPMPPTFITPVIPEPTYSPLEDTQLPHHTSLPELVGRYGTQQATDALPTTVAPTDSVSPTGQPVPHHTSLKDLVSVPPQSVPEPDYPAVNDLPTSPITQDQPVLQSEDHIESDIPQAGTLNIKH